MIVSVVLQDDHLAVWHRTAADQAAAARVRDALRRILQLPASVPIEYKAHGDCLRAAAPVPAPAPPPAPAPALAEPEPEPERS